MGFNKPGEDKVWEGLVNESLQIVVVCDGRWGRGKNTVPEGNLVLYPHPGKNSLIGRAGNDLVALLELVIGSSLEI